MSLTPVRHAIQQLATEGLIEIKPRSGTFVATLSIEDIEATFDVRIAPDGARVAFLADTTNWKDDRYETVCDPRLNGRQSLDLAFRVAELMRAAGTA